MFSNPCSCAAAHMSVFAASFTTCAVGPPAVNVVIGLPLLSDLVGVDEYHQHCNQTDERHQHRRTEGRVDVRDEAPKGGWWGGGCDKRERT